MSNQARENTSINFDDESRTISLRFGEQAHEIVAETPRQAVEAVAMILFDEHARAEEAIGEMVAAKEEIIKLVKEFGPLRDVVVSLQCSMEHYHGNMMELARTSENEKAKVSQQSFADGIKWSFDKLKSLLRECGAETHASGEK